jgi:hypothetical protein
MKTTAKTLAYPLFVIFFLCPVMTKAQGSGQIQCTRPDDSIYLYGSVTTMEVRANLKCGEEVQILNRYDNFLYVRTEKGVVGYVPLDSVARGSAKRSSKPASTASTKKGATPAPQMLTLFDGTPVRLKLSREVSSANAHVNDEVPFEVTEDVVVGGFTVIRKGTKATGTVAEVAPKGRFGKSGKLTVNLTSVRLVDNETAGLRLYQESQNERRGVSKVLPIKGGKDVTLAEGTEMFGYVTGGMHLVASKFPVAKGSANSTSASASDRSRP